MRATTRTLPYPETAVPTASRILLGRYRLTRRLGAGGFGVVWQARDERLERDVAVKLVPARGEARTRALREAQAAARLNHPAVVGLYEAAESGDVVVLVSELVSGRSLDQLLDAALLSDRDILEVGAVLCAALGHAHARGVVHRDIKPGNVIVPHVPPAPGAVAKLADFGVASVAGQDAITRTGDVVGTLAYMAPEQAAGQQVGPEADLFSLALLVYEGLSGINPRRGETPAETAQLLRARLPSLRTERRDLPRDLIAAVDRALSIDPAARGTLAEFAASLRENAGRVDDADSTVVDRRGHARRRGSGTLAVAVAGTGLIAGLIAAIQTAPAAVSRMSLALAAVAVAPAIAGLARRALVRFALGVCAFWAFVLAGVAVHAPIVADAVDEAGVATAPPVTPLEAAVGVIGATPALAGAALWGIAALVLPWVIPRRAPLRGLVGAAVWVLSLVTAGAILREALGPLAAPIEPVTVAAGAAAGGLLALAVQLARGEPGPTGDDPLP